MLTGRVLTLVGDARINASGDQYNVLGQSRAEGRMRELNFFASDSWRLRPSLTVSAGLRYVLQNPFYPMNNSYTFGTVEDLYGISGVGNLFKPGTLGGSSPSLDQYKAGDYAFKTDKNNLAPSVGAAWQVPGMAHSVGRLFLR
jgi:hypothetical protein